MMRLKKATLLGGMACLAILTGCSNKLSPITNTDLADNGFSINNGQSFFPDNEGEVHAPLPNLKHMQNLMAVDASESPKQRAEETMFLPAMRDAALQYGVAGGLAWSTAIVNGQLRAHSAELAQVYDFTRIATYAPGGNLILPPVISQSNDTYQESDFGRQIRVASTTYDIVRQAQFAPSAPLWFSYLYRPWTPARKPENAVLPRNDNEEQQWNQYVQEGWQIGVQQGLDSFKLDLAKLNQDFDGMIRYRTLYNKGLVSAPVLVNDDLGTTGTGQTMRVDDRDVRIVSEPTLAVPTPTGNAPVRRPAPSAQTSSGMPTYGMGGVAPTGNILGQ